MTTLADRRVGNATEVAEELGVARTGVYFYLRMRTFPQPLYAREGTRIYDLDEVADWGRENLLPELPTT